MKPVKCVLPVVLALLGLALPAYADYAVGPFGSNPDQYATGTLQNVVVGWQFSITPGTTVTLTQLGLYDVGANGFAEAHDVGIWEESTQSLLRQASISSADTLDPTTRFRYKDVTPLTLAQGVNYRIGSLFMAYSADEYLEGILPGDFNKHPRINFLGGVQVNSGGGLVYPANYSAGNKWFGPSFAFTTAEIVIPEPATFALAVLGFAGALVVMARKRS